MGRPRFGTDGEEVELLCAAWQRERQKARRVADAQERRLRGGPVLEVLDEHKLVALAARGVEGDEVNAGGRDEAR